MTLIPISYTGKNSKRFVIKSFKDFLKKISGDIYHLFLFLQFQVQFLRLFCIPFQLIGVGVMEVGFLGWDFMTSREVELFTSLEEFMH